MKFFYVPSIIFLAFMCFYGQNKSDNTKVENNKVDTSARIKIDRTKPSVYLDFERVGEGDAIYADDVKERVWLMLINNSKWSIYIGEFTFGKDNTIGLFHEVEKEKNNLYNIEIPKGYKQGDARSPDSELKPGKSISFSVPKNHLGENLKIRVDYIYQWENDTETSSFSFSEPRHSIFFSSSDLKRFLKKTNKLRR